MFNLTTAIKYLFKFFFFSFLLFTGNKLLAQLTVVTANTQTGTTSTTHALTNVPAGALLLLATSGENANTTCSVSGNSLTWTKKADAQASNSGDAEIWTAVNPTLQNVTVISTWPSSPAQASVCYVITGQETVLGGASANGTSQSAPSVSITTTKANSILFCVTTDYRATDAGATRMYRSTPVTERFYNWNTNHLTTYHYTKDATTITAYTMGLTAPDMQYGGGTAVLEIRPADGSDTQAPTVSITAPAAGTVSGTINVNANASDNVGVAGVQFLLDGVNLGAEDVASPYSVSWNTTTATNGTHTLTARARDAAGNTATSTGVVVTVNNPDTQAPTVSITAPAAGNVSGTINVTANASDNVGVAGVQFLLDGVNLGAEDVASPYSVSWNTTTATNGNHTLTAVARDAAGNTTTSNGVVVTVNNTDTQSPTVSITAPAAGNVSGTINVTANASDNVGVAGVQFLLDGVNLGAEDVASPYSVSWNTTTATNGNHTLTAVARDAAGNTTTSAGVVVTVNNADTQSPTVSITAPAAGTVSGTINADVNASDNVGVAGVQFLLNGVNLGAEDIAAPYSISWNTSTSANGTYTLTARARDAAGNTAISTGVIVTVNNITGSGITSINSLTGASQTLATGTSGTDFNISSTANTHSFNIPTASVSNRGLLSSSDWSAFNSKIAGSIANIQVGIGNGTNTISGSSNLTFDGYRLLIGGVPIGLAKVHIYENDVNGAAFRTENGAAEGPIKYAFIGQMGPNAFGVPDWQSAAVIEGAANGGLYMGAYMGNLKLAAGLGARTVRMTILGSNGNVGINNALPSEKLDVTGNVRFSGAFMPNNSAGTAGYLLQSNGAGAAPSWVVAPGSTGSGWGLTGNNGTNPLTNFLGTTDAQRLVFRTDNTEKATIDAAGNVGIGTSTPAYKLEVNGSIKNNGEATFGNGTGYGWAMTGVNSIDQFSSYRASGAIINAINGPLYLSGKPGSDVLVRRYIKINSDNNGLDGLILQANSINTAAIDGTRELTMGANQVNALKIFQNGNIALQTGGTYTDAGYKLDINGSLRATGSVRLQGLSTNNSLTNILATDASGNVSWRNASTLGSGGNNSVTYVTGDYTIQDVDKNLLLKENGVQITFPDPSLHAGRVISITHDNFYGSVLGSGCLFAGSYIPVHNAANAIISSQALYTTAEYVSDGAYWRKAGNSKYFFPQNITVGGEGIVVTGNQTGYSESGEVSNIAIKGLKAGSGISLSSDNNDITISANGGGSGGNWTLSGTNIYNSNAGLVTIGTSTNPNPSDANLKLAVNGNIYSKKVKVTQTGWPDYVFHQQYKLPTLKEVEEFIQKNKHLPDVPSATEVEKNGLDLGDNQSVLLKKIEELTLYLIEINKKVEKLTEENEILKRKLEIKKN